MSNEKMASRGSFEQLNGSEKERLLNWINTSRWEFYPLDKPENVLGELDKLPRDLPIEIACRPDQGIVKTLEFGDKVAAMGFKTIMHFTSRGIGEEKYLPWHMEGLKPFEDIFFIAGDIKNEDAGPIRSTLELFNLFKKMEFPFKSIGIPGYPEGHNFLKNDIVKSALRDKLNFIRESQKLKPNINGYICTQFCFDVDNFLQWVRELRKDGITTPIYFGIPGAIPFKNLWKVLREIGGRQAASFALKYKELIEEIVGGMIRGKLQYTPNDLMIELAKKAEPSDNIAGFVITTMNRGIDNLKYFSEVREQLVKG